MGPWHPGWKGGVVVSLGTTRICNVCRREYTQWAPRQKTCTKKCSRERARRYNKKYREENK
jgi:hypothetical protein